MKRHPVPFLVLIILIFSIARLNAQENPNLVNNTKVASVDASSINDPPWCHNPWKILDERLQVRWETDKETTGAWITVKFRQQETVKEIWLLTKSVPFDIRLDPFFTGPGAYLLPKKITLTFSDGTTLDAAVLPVDKFQIIKLPTEKKTDFIKLTIRELWQQAGANGTGIAKIRAYAAEHSRSISMKTFDMFDVINQKPVKSAEIEFVNPGAAVENAHLVINSNNKVIDDVPLGTLDSAAVFFNKIWIPSPYQDEDYQIALYSGNKMILQTANIPVTAYKKTYFEGGTFNINSGCHNDLGWLSTQSETADYRSEELILSTLKIMETNPEFTYAMEGSAYLIEFLVRHPEKKEEIVKRMRENRFTFAGSYVQMLEAHVGAENLARQFYLGRRWLIENFPGVDVNIYMKTDPPSMTMQIPQILKSAGIDYMIQGRIPLGYYNWQGLDGTIIPTYGLRYWKPSQLLNPKNGEGWMKYMFSQEDYYKSHNLPKVMNYDFDVDYLPPCPVLIPFVKEQNEAMKNFATDWNNHWTEKGKQIQPPVLKFVNPENMLKQIFSNTNINIETIKGEWPLSWAYYDEPSNREALLTGKKAHNIILSVEKLYCSIKQIDNSVVYPKASLDSAWSANCWPDHGWGGNKGLKTDSIYFDSYKRSLDIAQRLMQDAQHKFSSLLPKGNDKQIPLSILNSLNWNRTEPVKCTITLPDNWKGFIIKNTENKTVPFELIHQQAHSFEILFIAENVPSNGYCNYLIERSESIVNTLKSLTGDSIAISNLKIVFGKSGIKKIINLSNEQNYINSNKFEAGEILQFSAPGDAWDEWKTHEDVNMEDFDKSTNHKSNVIRFTETPVRFIREVETEFKYFTSRTRFILYKQTGDIEVETDILNWTGEHNWELRMAFPFNIEQARVSYEIPFGTADYLKDEIDETFWKNNKETQYRQFVSGGKAEIPYREAINWINVSSSLIGVNHEGFGCLMASDMTLHLFEDQTSNPVSYPVMQHVLLSTRRCLSWNPEFWFEQKGDHHYRMALYFHDGNWRFRYHDAIGFNNPMTACLGTGNAKATQPESNSFLSVNQSNIIVTAMKQSENGKGTVVRFYEAEGKKCTATLRMAKPIKEAFQTSLLEYNPVKLPINTDGSVSVPVRPWEITTLMLNY